MKQLLQRTGPRLKQPCVLCRESGSHAGLCPECETALCHRVRSATRDWSATRCARCALALAQDELACPDCSLHPPAFDRVVVAFDYLPPADQLILQLKNQHRLPLAALLAKLLVESLYDQALPLPADTLIVPIPASAVSLHRRGFNPAGQIAQFIAKILEKPINYRALSRKNTVFKQSQSMAIDRRQQMKGVFVCDVTRLPPVVAVVDDVMTTGSTLNEAARVLKQAGAQVVVALAAARRPL